MPPFYWHKKHDVKHSFEANWTQWMLLLQSTFLVSSFLMFVVLYISIWFHEYCSNGLTYKNTILALLDKKENLYNGTYPWIYFYFLISWYCCFCSENCDQLSWLWRSVMSLQSRRQPKSEVFIIICSFNFRLFKPTWKKKQIKTGNWYYNTKLY